VLEATHARRRLVLAPHPSKPLFDAFWIDRGRVADWGPLPAPAEVRERSQALTEAQPQRGPELLSPDQVDEVRIVSSWLAANDAPELDLAEQPGPEVEEFLAVTRA
jgi:hypothetical protein